MLEAVKKVGRIGLILKLRQQKRTRKQLTQLRRHPVLVIGRRSAYRLNTLPQVRATAAAAAAAEVRNVHPHPPMAPNQHPVTGARNLRRTGARNLHRLQARNAESEGMIGTREGIRSYDADAEVDITGHRRK